MITRMRKPEDGNRRFNEDGRSGKLAKNGHSRPDIRSVVAALLRSGGPKTKGMAFALALFISLPAFAISPAAESGACSLAETIPATVAFVDDNFEILLDDGRRATLSGLEFPPPAKHAPDPRAAAYKRLSDWLAGRDVFLGAFASAPDRWGRIPARIFSATGDEADAPIVSVGSALLEQGLARFRPDPPAFPCVQDYLAAEAPARDNGRGIWADAAAKPTVAGEGSVASLLHRKGMTILEGKINDIGETRGAIYLNFGQKRAENVSIIILRRNLAILQASGIDPQKLVGRLVRVRGLIETGFGPRMEISTPAEIEILENAGP